MTGNGIFFSTDHLGKRRIAAAEITHDIVVAIDKPSHGRKRISLQQAHIGARFIVGPIKRTVEKCHAAVF